MFLTDTRNEENYTTFVEYVIKYFFRVQNLILMNARTRRSVFFYFFFLPYKRINNKLSTEIGSKLCIQNDKSEDTRIFWYVKQKKKKITGLIMHFQRN